MAAFSFVFPVMLDAIRAARFGPLCCRGKFGIRLGVLGSVADGAEFSGRSIRR
jgi:hypothetical protein